MCMMLRAPDLESRQSTRSSAVMAETDAPRPGFGIKAKQDGGTLVFNGRCSAPRIWNQGKASRRHCFSRRSMLRAPDLESRQSASGGGQQKWYDAPRPGFGIKAKLHRRLHHRASRCSAPRIWNQGKAAAADTRTRFLMLRAPDLESRQSKRLRELATNLMLRAPDLESRQSRETVRTATFDDAPRPGFGIAKRNGSVRAPDVRCSAPRIWNQGKAPAEGLCPRQPMLRAPDLESRQSTGGSQLDRLSARRRRERRFRKRQAGLHERGRPQPSD